MRHAFFPALCAALLAVLCHEAAAQNSNPRSRAAYHPNAAIDPATLMSQQNFTNAASRGYVVVEGYIDYVAGTISKDANRTWVKTEADGNFHFEMQTTNRLRPAGNSPDGLVCEIDPAWQLDNSNALGQISRKNPSTYRKVRVYGSLRFGTEAGHSGTKNYKIGDGKTIKNHWELHPVERDRWTPKMSRKRFAINPCEFAGGCGP